MAKLHDIIPDRGQRKIIYSDINFNILAIAPPGAGKTTVMAKRIQYLLNNNLIPKPFKILGLTFSNAAANEMKKRISTEDFENRVQITTFHSFAFSALKSYGYCIGINNDFRIISEYEKDKTLNKLIKIEFQTLLRKFAGINRKKEEKELRRKYNGWFLEIVLKCNNSYHCEEESSFLLILQQYRKILSKSDLIDHDHILYYANELFDNNPKILSYYSAVFKSIIIDEFQDTNMLQYKLLKKIFEFQKGFNQILILADPNQAIYSFQGATPKNIDKAMDEFQCNKLFLKNNHRIASKEIKTLLENFSLKFENLNHPEIYESEKICLDLFPDEDNEKRYVIYCINELIQKGVSFHEIAILAPAKYVFDGLPSKLKEKNWDFVYIPELSKNNILEKYDLFFKELLKYQKQGEKLQDVVESIAKDFSIDKDVVKILVSFSKKYDSKNFQNLPLYEKINKFYNDFTLNFNIEDSIQKNFKNRLFISTIHGAKGLEFDNVIIIGLNSGVIPHFTFCNQCNGNSDENDLLEYLNLLNVGISRAKKKLFLGGARSMYGYQKHGTCLLKNCVDFKDLIIVDK